MKIPNPEAAIIDLEKLRSYLLNLKHPRGGSKARLLHHFGYSMSKASKLESDLRKYHLSADVADIIETKFGTRYIISSDVLTPSERALRLRSIWHIDNGSDVPRLITIVPETS